MLKRNNIKEQGDKKGNDQTKYKIKKPNKENDEN
jgi:hypothetical protein